MSGYRTESSPSSFAIPFFNRRAVSLAALFQRWGMKLVFLILTTLFFVSSAAAQVENSSSLNPVGSGARAAGMGGAFIGVADDATAASWNPAGLIQLERPEISAVYSFFQREQKYKSEKYREMEGDNSMHSDGLNYASIAYPFVLMNRNMIVSLNYQRLYEMNKDTFFRRFVDVGIGVLTQDTNFRQDGFLYALSPALAMQVTPYFSLGATLNIWDNVVGKNGWKTTYRIKETGDLGGMPYELLTSFKNDTSFKGTNAHFGFLWTINGAFTLGGVYKTPFDADIKNKMVTTYTLTAPVHEINSFSESNDMTLKMPASYGLGLAYRHSDNLTIAFDIYRTEWSRYVQVDKHEAETNPFDGQSIHDGRLVDTTQVRMGMEYLFIKEKYAVPVRFGIFYDPEPQKGHVDEYYGFSAGTGYAKGRVALDCAYQFRMGRNLTGDVPAAISRDVDIDVKQHLFMISSIFYF